MTGVGLQINIILVLLRYCVPPLNLKPELTDCLT